MYLFLNMKNTVQVYIQALRTADINVLVPLHAAVRSHKFNENNKFVIFSCHVNYLRLT